MRSFTYINVPGFTGSGPLHWQSLWEQGYENFHRVQQKDWEHPQNLEWIEALDQCVAQFPEPIILVGHSLGCLTIVNWIAEKFRALVRAALLVAPCDPQNPNFPSQARQFKIMRLAPLPIPSTLVTSSNDPYLSLEKASILARSWGSMEKRVGKCGHINSNSNLGMWPEGKALLDQLAARVSEAST